MPVILNQSSQSLAPFAQLTVRASANRLVTQVPVHHPTYTDTENVTVIDEFNSLVKSSGSSNVYDAYGICEETFWGNQIFSAQFNTEITNAQFGENGSVLVKSTSDGSKWFWLQTAYYGANYYARAIINGVVHALFNIGLNETVRIRFTGFGVAFEKKSAGQWTTQYLHSQIPQECEYEIWYMIGIAGAHIYRPLIETASFAGEPQPHCWSWAIAPELTVLSGSGNERRLLMPDDEDVFQVCASTPLEGDACILLTIEPLQILNADEFCDSVVEASQILFVDHNGGDTAQLVVSGGIVLDSHHWQLPSVAGEYSVQVKIPATDDNEDIITEPCYICIAPRLSVSFEYSGETITLFDGDTFTGLYPGAKIQLNASCLELPCENVAPTPPTPLFSCEDFPNNIDEITGEVTMPGDARDEMYGFVEMVIQLGCGGRSMEFTLKTLPIYPTPDVCGPDAKKYPVVQVEFQELENIMKGGSAEKFAVSKTPVRIWESLEYRGLVIDAATQEGCRGVKVDPHKGTSLGCDIRLATAERIDNFYRLVAGRTGRFFYRDMNTGLLWKNVSFKEKLRVSHENNDFFTGQARSVSLIWRPEKCETDGIVDVPSAIPPSLFPYRVTEEGETRITEEINVRILE